MPRPRRRERGLGPILLATSLALSIAPLSAARADGGLDAQVTSRLTLGGGFSEEAGALEGVFDLGARVGLMVGDDRPARVRLGPELMLRTATFESIEVLLGAALLLPIDDFAVGIVVSGGYAWRLPRPSDGSRDGPVIAATLRFGYQPYDHFDAYSMGLHLFATGIAGTEQQPRYEVIFGVEIDMELLFVTPVRLLILLTSSGDPDEPEEADEPDEAASEGAPSEEATP